MSFLKKLDSLDKAMKIIPKRMGIEAVGFTKQRFVHQNWIDDRTEVWPKRKTSRGSKARNRGAVLVDSARLKRSPRVVSTSVKKIIIGTDVPYAQAHNDGFRGVVKVKAHKRNLRSRNGRNKQVNVKAHDMRMNLPRRRILGNSAPLARQIERVATAEFNKALNSL